MTKPPTALLALAGLASAGLIATGTVSATAFGGGHDDRQIKTGGCSDSAQWKLKVKTDDGRLEVEGEVDSNRPGQTWAWQIKDDGAVKSRGTATTGGRSGSFSIERTIADGPGIDHVTFRAVRPGTGAVCQGTITF